MLLPRLVRIVWNRFLPLYRPSRCLAKQMMHGGIYEKVLAFSSRNKRVWITFHQLDLARPRIELDAGTHRKYGN